MKTQTFIKNTPKEIRLHALGHCKSLSELVLDPRAWKANAEAQGWEKECYKDEDIHKTKMMSMMRYIKDGGTKEGFIKLLK